ncbi:MAG: hypothetical protein WEB33_09680 [Bacteroidota bacterium]
MGIPLLAYLAGGAIVLPFIFGLFAAAKLEKDLKPLLGLFGIHTLFTVFQFVLAFQRVNNIWTSHTYYLIEVAMVFWIYSQWIYSTRARSIFLGLSILYGIFWTAAKFSFEEFTVSALYTPTVSRVILLGSTLHILVSIASNIERPLYLEPKFWFAAGFLVMYSGSLMFYAFRTLIFGSSLDAIFTLLSIHWITTILSNVLHVIGFLCILRLPNTGGQLELAQ